MDSYGNKNNNNNISYSTIIIRIDTIIDTISYNNSINK